MDRSFVRKLLFGFVLGCLLGLAFVVARAQEGPPPGPPPGMMGGSQIDVRKFGAERELARLTKKYKLTEDQKAQIKPALVEQEKQVHALGEDTALSDTEYVAAVRRVHRETVAKVKLQLSDEQASRYAKDEEKLAKSDAEDDAIQEDGPPGGPPPEPPPGGGGPPM